VRLLPDSRGARTALVSATVALAVCTLQFTLHPSGSQHFVVYWLYNGLVLAAGCVCVARGLTSAYERAAWVLIGGAVISWGIGNTIWTFVYVGHPSPPYPSICDAFWLAVYPPLYVAVLLLLHARSGGVRRSVWLDGVIAGLAVAALGTAIVFQAVLDATSGSKAAIATNLSYPLADLTLIGLVVYVLAVSGWRIASTWGVIAAGLLVFSTSDCLYLFQTAAGSYVAGGPTDLGWVAGCVLLAWAAWQPVARSRSRHESRPLLIVPVAFGLLALSVLVYGNFRHVNTLSLTLATAAILAVIGRLGLTFYENARMLDGSRAEARTDVLTGLGNRRKLLHDLEGALACPDPHMLVLFDLNGFKQYNDVFGHPAGDALLARLGDKLGRFVRDRGAAYRMGGDEFCLLCSEDIDRDALVEGAARALADYGDGFAITAAHGSVFLPREATSAAEALRLADQRMYADKQGARRSASEQSSLVLLRALSECHPRLDDHVLSVARLAEAVANELGMPARDVAQIRLAGALHDVGKMAVPAAILEKRGPLNEDDWKFVRRHTLIGARILDAAPDLTQIADIVRSTHERFDGRGHPDGLAGQDIPLAARIIFVCDSFDAMISNRPYGSAMAVDHALTELARRAGTQFDPAVVAAFGAALRTVSFRSPAAASTILRVVKSASA
jgi:diguanylate cyclase (GGDEF)-like protein/putative nucleotidyltransferase with HDIG domain